MIIHNISQATNKDFYTIVRTKKFVEQIFTDSLSNDPKLASEIISTIAICMGDKCYQSIIEYVVEILKKESQDNIVISHTLVLIYKVLDTTYHSNLSENDFAALLQDTEGLDIIENLANDKNTDIASKA